MPLVFPTFLKMLTEYGWGKVQRRVGSHQLMTAKDQAIAHLSQLHIQHLQEAGVELIQAHTKFVGAHTLDVGGGQITAEKILIAVGGEAVKPKIPGMEYAITSYQHFELKPQPEHIVIISSDYIPARFAGSMNGLISNLTLVMPEGCILPGAMKIFVIQFKRA
jgi:glutathione reductase (NADPH)